MHLPTSPWKRHVASLDSLPILCVSTSGGGRFGIVLKRSAWGISFGTCFHCTLSIFVYSNFLCFCGSGPRNQKRKFSPGRQEMAAKNFLQMFNNFFTWKCPQPGNRGRITSFFIYLFKFLQLFVIYTIKFNVSNKTHNLTQWKTVKKVVPPNAWQVVPPNAWPSFMCNEKKLPLHTISTMIRKCHPPKVLGFAIWHSVTKT